MEPDQSHVLAGAADRARNAARLNRLLRAAGYIGAAARWRPLAGGRTNMVWRLHGGARDGGDLVCKLSPPGRDTPLFPNRPEREAEVLRHLAGSGLAPDLRIAFATDMGHCLLYRHVAGTPKAAAPAAIRAGLDRLHRHPALPGLRILSATPEALLAAGDGMLAALGPAHRALLIPRRPCGFDLTPSAPVLLHGDPVPSNILATPGGICLLDFQCPALGDPVLDFALVLSPAMNMLEKGAPLPARERAEILADPALAERFARLEPILLWRMACYCAWRIERGAAGYRAALAAELERLDGLADPE